MYEPCVGPRGVGDLVPDRDFSGADGPEPPPRGSEVAEIAPTSAPTARILPFRPRERSVTADRLASASPCGDEADAVIARAEEACTRYRRLAAECGLRPTVASRRKHLCRKMEEALALLRSRRRAAEQRRSGKFD
jgi:hypothetical protein